MSVWTEARLAWRLGRGADRREWWRAGLTAAGAALATGFAQAAVALAALRGQYRISVGGGLLDRPGERSGVVLALLLLLVPVLGFLGQCARIGAVHRDRRLAGLRLAGATPAQVRGIAALETGPACLLSSLLATVAAVAADVSSRADAVAAGSEQMSASIREIAVGAAAASKGTSNAVRIAGVANERLAKLGESSTRIGAVTKLISAIADQTNLLALNATIEAARAGEAGKGFAVVANEVKDLTGRTRTAAAEITEMIGAIQADSTDAEKAIGDILRLINEIEQQQATLASAVEEQTAVASEMSSGVAAVADGATSSARVSAQLRESAAAVAANAAQLDSLFTA